MFGLTEETLATVPFFVNKQGGLTVNAAKLLDNLDEARSAGRCGGSWSRCPSGTSARPRPGRWPPRSARWTRSRRRRPRSWPPSRASARRSPARHGVVRRGLARGRSWTSGGPPASGWPSGRVRRRRPAAGAAAAVRAPLAGVTVVLTGTLEGQPGRGRRGGTGAGRQGLRLGVQEDRLRGGRRQAGVQVGQGATRSACRYSTRRLRRAAGVGPGGCGRGSRRLLRQIDGVTRTRRAGCPGASSVASL